MSRKSRTAGLYEAVREDIGKIQAAVRLRVDTKVTYVSKEWYADLLGARQHEVEDVFRQLNREGLLAQVWHHGCPDRGMNGKNKCWHPDLYRVN